tara:strand:+ start:54720 stop:56003 length:1284 start_codon:yes stop_codon:yes gene_type:complete
MRQLLIIISLIFSFHLLSKVNESTNHLEKIVLGSGCFWGAEKGYESLEGVVDAISGYSDGKEIKPTYKEITKFINRFNPNNFAEVVEVTYNTNVISTESLLKHFFESHDPTQLHRQGNDIGTQYRTIVLTTSKQQTEIGFKLLKQYQLLLSQSGYGEIVTEIKPLKAFYKAESYHQNYIAKNPKGYCPDHSTGVVFAENNPRDITDNSYLKEGKHIVVIEPEGYCPYCEKFRKEVLADYFGTIKITFRKAYQLDGLTIKSDTWATPTIIFMDNGKEILSHQGYMEASKFYQALGILKLGNSEAFEVAFNEGTDPRFCKEYQIFKDTPDGIFIDKLSGAPLFDTKDRFNSLSGWLSFTKPIIGAVYRQADNSYGLRRIEIRSTSSGIHLGHVFNDGPNGLPRYCINATVLEFKPRDTKELVKLFKEKT